MLFGCLFVPDFPVQAVVRTDPNLGKNRKDIAIAILDGRESLLKVFARNQTALQAGIEIGMTKVQAELCIGAHLRRRSIIQEEAAQQALVDCAYSFSPRVESTSSGTVIVDLTGCTNLFGPPQEIGLELAHQAEQCGFDAHVGIASNPDAAACAARGFDGVSVIEPGEEPRRLACLPINVLQPAPEILHTLDSWGIRDCKSLAKLPRVPLVERLGQEGLRLQRLARGEMVRELVPVQDKLQFRESLELEDAVELLEPLLFLCNRLLEQLLVRLNARSLATNELQLDLTLEVYQDRRLDSEKPAGREQTAYHCFVKLPVPTQDARVLLRLLHLELAAHPPNAPVKQVTMEALPARQRLTQSGLFQPLAPEPEQLEITLARLRAVVGQSGRVGAPQVIDSHRRDHFQVLPFSVHDQQPQRDSAPRLALRLFRPVLAARVQLAAGVPASITFRGMKARVLTAAGPWRSSGEWWDRAEQWKRDEWDLCMQVGTELGLYRVYRDLFKSEWFVEGIYD